MRTFLHSAVFALLLVAPFSWGDVLPKPKGNVILSISGNITNTNAPGRADFDMAMLKAYPQHELKMKTPWTEGMQRFDGVALDDLLKTVGAHGTKVRASALNDYHSTLDLKELRGVKVIVAIRHNGSYMRVRNKGPLWIVYPTKGFPEAEQTHHESNQVWQLRSLEIH